MKRIGVFDSGLGGLSVAARILDQLPDERIIYFADNAHVPYGERQLEEIREFATAISGFLIERGAKAIVMACNMSSAVALDSVRELYPDTPVLGVIRPGARAAVRKSNGGAIGVLATTGTVKSGAYTKSIQALDPAMRVIEQPCPKFVPLVESGRAETKEAEVAASEYAGPLIDAGISTAILGCTHYPFLRKAIALSFGPNVTIIDPSEETVEELQKLLCERGLEAEDAPGEHLFYTSGEQQNFAELGSRFLGRPIETVERAVWGVDLGKVLV